jgi:GTP pyrophosphokinase
MEKQKYDMRTEKPDSMDSEHMQQLKEIFMAPYMQIATGLIGKARHAGGNMFRHQMDTLAILIDYGYIDSVLLKASIVHDTVEDIPNFDRNLIVNADSEGQKVLDLVLEVTRRENETKKEFLQRILDTGSQKAKILKCADRISNMISLGYVTDPKFIERYCDETEYYLLPMALEIDFNMYHELIKLIMTRRRYLEDGGYFDTRHKESSGPDSTK